MVETVYDVMIMLMFMSSLFAVYYASKTITKMSGHHINTFNCIAYATKIELNIS